jgi:hypothetical protein
MKARLMTRSVRNGIVAVILFVVSTSRWLSAGEAPAFLQVGKTYSVIFGMEYQFTVLEIGKDGWIRVSLRQRNQVAWINTNAVPVISPNSP